VVAHVPSSYPAAWPATFGVVPSVTNSAAPVTFDWDFGDGTPHSTSQFAAHAYATPGTYHWTATATVSGVPASDSGIITITSPVILTTMSAGNLLTLSWPNAAPDTLLEASSGLGRLARWTWVTNAPTYTPSTLSVTLPMSGTTFYRVRQPW